MWMLPLLLAVQGDSLQVELPVSTPERSHQAAVIFEDEPAISKIVLGMDREAISVDVVENRLFLKLLRPAAGHLDCVGASGRLYRIRVSVGERAPVDALRVRGARPVDRAAPRPVALVRMMRTGRVEEGAARARIEGAVYECREFKARGCAVYRWEGLRGYVLEIENRGAEALAIDLSRFRGEGLLLAGCRELSVPPGGRTLLYLVFEEAP
jgi:hypothetical protein